MPARKHISRKALLIQAGALLLTTSCSSPSNAQTVAPQSAAELDVSRLRTPFGATPVGDRLDTSPCHKDEVSAESAHIKADGKSPMSSAISQLLNTPGSSRVYFGRGTYLIDAPVVVRVSGSLRVRCHPQAVFRLAANARCHMFEIIGNDVSTFTWLGGTIDGNDANQGDGRADGSNFDLSKGLRVVRHRSATIGQAQFRSIRGHAVNHWNNASFRAHDLRFNQPIDPIQPVGGRRRDGVTGASDHVLIERLSGFTSDDMVAICAGASWSGSDTYPANVKSVVIRDIQAGTKWDPQHHRYRSTWHGVTLYPSGGFTINSATISNVSGHTQCGHLRAGGYAAVASGTIGSLTVTNLSGRCRSTGADTFVGLGGTSPVNRTTITTAEFSGITHTIVGSDNSLSVRLAYMSTNSLAIRRSTSSKRGHRGPLAIQLNSAQIQKLQFGSTVRRTPEQNARLEL